MKALFFNKKLKLKNVKPPIPSNNEALIETNAAGICNTDLEIIKGYMNFKGILGHEFVGTVIQASNSKLIGKKVVGEINIGCGNCHFCSANLPRHCQKRKILGIAGKDGTMAEFITLPVKNLHILPTEINPYYAVFIEPLAAACEILEQIHIEPAHKIMLLGDGKLATLIAQVINLINPNLYVKGKHTTKIKLLNNLNLNAGNKLFDKNKWDIIIEATGNPEGLMIALDYIKPRGTIILKSTYHNNLKINQSNIVINEVTLVGSRCGNFNIAINLLKQNLIKLQPLITKILPLEKYEQAFSLAQNPNSFKIIFDITTIN